MTSPQRCMHLLIFIILLSFLAFAALSAETKLHKILMKREVPSKSEPAGVAITPSEAQEFLTLARRPRRNIWDRSRPDVQQWIMQFMYMGYDEAKLETDLSYWMDQSHDRNQDRQHHYDENAPIGPRDTSSYRHGANVNYDDY